MDEPVCKPGSVPGGLAAIPFGDHPSRRTVAGTFQRSTRRLGRAALERLRTPVPHECEPRASRPCSGWGLPSRPGHPGRWWSLTPPFHPDRFALAREPAVCFLWHCPAAHAGLPLTTTLPCGARTFLGVRPTIAPANRSGSTAERRGRPTDSSATHPTVVRRAFCSVFRLRDRRDVPETARPEGNSRDLPRRADACAEGHTRVGVASHLPWLRVGAPACRNRSEGT